MPKANNYGLILAGGRGTRFWPRSRRARAKQVLTFFGERSLIQQTVDRLKPVLPPERIWILTNDHLRDEIVRQLPEVPRKQIIAEPAQRNTAPAIGLAAHVIGSFDPDAVMGVFPADHIIQKPSRFVRLLRPAFRAAQLSQHYFGRLVRDPAAMTDVPADTRERLAADLMPRLLTAIREQTCDDGATRKTLWRLHDGALVESVLMGYRDRVTICVSSQAGCGMGCPFCATGQAGLVRNLSTAEIVDQVVWFAGLAARGTLPGAPARLSHVVFMGMGEPLANYNRVLSAIRRLVAAPPDGLGLSQRHITVSTVGLVPAISRLAAEDLALTLALSLHAPDDDLRDELVPVNRRWKVDEVLQAAWDYCARTGRRVSIEYALIRGVNDQRWRADMLGKLLAGRNAHVNLIPLNPTPGSRWDASPKPVEREFVQRLRAAGVPTTVRDTRGREIDGACGQLAASESEPRLRRRGRKAEQ